MNKRNKKLALLAAGALAGLIAVSRSDAPRTDASEMERLLESPQTPLPDGKNSPTAQKGGELPPDEPVAEARPPLDQEEAAAHWQTLSTLSGCIEGGECPEKFPDATPSSQYFAIRDRILAEVEWFKGRAPVGPEQKNRSVQAAHSLLAKVEDEMVQLSLLEWLLTLPSNPETPPVIAKNVQNVVDVELIQAVARLFRRDRRPSNEAVINEYVFATIDKGATLASIEMAKELPQLLTSENRAQMQMLLNVLPKDTMRERYVRLALFNQ